MTRPRVLVSQPIHEAGMALLASRCDAVVAPDPSVATLRGAIRDAEALLARTAPVPAEVIEAAPALRVIARHVPLTPATRGLLDARALACLRPTAFLINTSRGGVVDEAALEAALSAGRLRGAALDVFEGEPPPADHPLFALPNVIVTPHSAALTAECAVRMATGAARAIIDVLDGRRPADVVNPEVYA